MKSKILTKGRSRPQKKTRFEVASLNAKYMGPEPTYLPGQELTNSQKANSYRWYSYMRDAEDAREYAVTFLRASKMDDVADALETVPAPSFPLTASWIARMASCGYGVGKKSIDFAVAKFREAADKYARTQSDDAPAPEPKRTKAEEKAFVFISDMEEVLDKRMFDVDVYAALTGNSFPTSQTSKIKDYYAGLLKELEDVKKKRDAELVEGYRGVPRKDVDEMIKWVTHLSESCDAYAGNSKMARAPRVKKPKSAEVKLKHFVYLREHAPLKIKSIDPATVIGARELWCFNIKYRAITKLTAAEGKTLDVKGKSVVGHDLALSKSVTVGKEAEKYIGRVRDVSRSNTGSVLVDVKNRLWPRAKNLIDENTVLLRVIR